MLTGLERLMVGLQQFWERFTGGDFVYAPTVIRIDSDTPPVLGPGPPL